MSPRLINSYQKQIKTRIIFKRQLLLTANFFYYLKDILEKQNSAPYKIIPNKLGHSIVTKGTFQRKLLSQKRRERETQASEINGGNLADRS